MARRRNLKTLAAIVAVRQVQQRGAEMAVAHADAALKVLRDEQSATQARLNDQHVQWSRSISGPVMRLPVAGAWSAEILGSEAALRRVNLNIEAADRDRADKAAAWRRSRAEAELAEAVVRSATRREQQWREETRMSDLADRFARMGGRS